ncbi:phBC6A51 family helix-turn-helix protein [Cohnella ginsengisoli]|uniref:PhBC6A51 family helix-turn-helix protein n=1 Tax=Cohnella ginsengisoli TaxID=425004 RepID=A0A9X4QMF7_9BACL|nr:phBC6A51 family helix-turn-helix protein [Cohnella ginsengisoli]MDG0791929.1 phBC6A51 family helix-turn-helix protein [Cohnella ginsengisoli]
MAAEKLQENLAYVPTKAELKLLEVIVDPANKDLNVVEKCEMAGISQRHYYDIWKKPEFVTYYNKLRMDLVKAHVGDILNATIRFATESASNHNDRKMLLEMAGIYTEKKEVKQDITAEATLNVIFDAGMG